MIVKCTPDNKGDGVFCDRKYMLGKQIHSEIPSFSVVFLEYNQIYCSTCFSTLSTNLLCCTECNLLYYCSLECRVSDGKSHTFECEYLQHLGSNSCFDYPSIVRIALRILFVSISSNYTNKILEKIHQVQYIHHIRNKLGMDTIDIISKFENLIIYCIHNLKLNITTKIDYLQLFMYLKTNLITVGDDENIGVGLYEIFSKINHSCVPNSVASFVNNRMYLFPLRDLVINEEILVNYCSTSMGFEERKNILNSYYFKCNCEMCVLNGNHQIDMMLRDTSKLISNKKLYQLCQSPMTYIKNPSKHMELFKLLVNDPAINDTTSLKLKVMLDLSNNMDFIEKYPWLVYQLVQRIQCAYSMIYGQNSQTFAKYLYTKCL